MWALEPLLLTLLAHSAVQAAAGARSTGSAACAVHRGSTPVAFQGSALLLTYYSGVSDSLLEHGWIRPGATPLHGLSGGAWTATLTALGYSGAAQRDSWKRWVGVCRKRWGACNGHVAALAEEAFGELLPGDAAERVGSRLHIALSQLDSRQTHLNGSASWLVSRFADKADLMAALAASSYIPGFSGAPMYRLYRGQPVIDGGFANGFDQLCPAGGCIKVASWYVGRQANHTCDPAACGCFASASKCSAPERRGLISHELFQNGDPPDAWALASVGRQCVHSSTAGVDHTRCSAELLHTHPLPDFVPHNQSLPDIHPGKYAPLPTFNGRQLLACEWQNWAMQLPAGQEMEAMDAAFQQGRADGSAWAHEQEELAGRAAAALQHQQRHCDSSTAAEQQCSSSSSYGQQQPHSSSSSTETATAASVQR